MQKRENCFYVGIDLRKEFHTAVLVNCWNEKLDAIRIENKPRGFIWSSAGISTRQQAYRV